MLWQSIRFEWRYYLRQPSFYVTSLLFFLMTFLAASSESIQIGGGGEVLGNGPFSVIRTLVTMLIFSMFLVVNFVGSTAIRNTTFQMEELAYSKPFVVWQYQLGRFLGCYAVVLAVFAFVPLGTLLGSIMPWVDKERFGPTQLHYYANAYLFFAVPTIFVLSATFYAIANKFRSMMAMYLVAVTLFVLYVVSMALSREPEYRQLAAIIDPFGLRTFAEVSRYWTISEKNTLMPEFTGVLLNNRLLWTAIGVGILLAFGGLFGKLTLSRAGGKKSKKAQLVTPDFPLSAIQTAASIPSAWQQFVTRTGFEMRQIFLSAPFIILSLICIFDMVAPLIDPQGLYGTPDWPLTQTMVTLVTDATSLLFVLIVIYYCAEVVWRERSSGMGDIVDSLPVSNMVFWLSKLVAVSLLMTSLYALCMAATLLYQLGSGFTDLDMPQYLVRLGFFSLLPFLMTVVLAFFIQVLSPNKYVGMLGFVIYYAISLVMSSWGFSHNMYQFASTPEAPFSDLNRFGWTLETQSWYLLYWGGLVAVMFVLGFGLYQRGPAQSLRTRFGLLRYQIGKSGLIAAMCGLFVFSAVGSWIFYNTRVLNTYTNAEQQMDLQAEYEKQFKAGQDDPILVATDVEAKVDIFPEQRLIKAEVVQQMRNKFDTPISKMLVNIPDYTQSLEIEVAGGEMAKIAGNSRTAWLNFATPIPAGASVTVTTRIVRQTLGFVDANVDTSLVENGTFINNSELLPVFGYQPGAELQDRHERSKRGLKPVERMFKLEDSKRYSESGFGRGEDFISFNATVSTSEDQMAIAPGYLQQQWVDKGRRYFHYQMDKPIFNFYAFLSARLAVKKEQYKGVSLEIYYHPAHHWNVERMMASMKDSLDYFNDAFGLYQHQQMRIIEFPGYRSFAQSFANTVPYSEQIGFISDLRDEDEIDMPYYVTAHEMAHQWWGHQVGSANVQGSAVIPETLAQYSALRVMEQKYGELKLRKFLKYELDRYLRGRSEEKLEEMPLLRAENQGYIHYRKGSVVMMALKDRIGVKRLDENLKAFLQEFQYKQNPYPTTLDLVRHLKTDLSIAEQAFVDDLFVNITLYDLRVMDIKSEPVGKDQLKLTLQIKAAKMTADGKGQETAQPLAEQIEIGAFSADPDEFSKDNKTLYLQKHQIKTGDNTIVITVPAGAAFVGIDPLIKLIDRDAADNVIKI